MARTGPTIHDVARAAGVSATTVSRALGHPHLVAASTVVRVQETSRSLGYSPSPQARWLHTGRTNVFTLVLPDITNPFFFDLIRGAQHEAGRSGYSQVLVDTEESLDDERDQIVAARKSADGIVLGGPRLPDAELIALSEVFPLVTVNRRIKGVPNVVIDTVPALSEAVGHLADLGHRSLAYVGGPSSAWSEPRRWRTVRTAARRRGIDCRRLGSYPPTLDAGRALATEFAESSETAVITYNDLQALGLLTGLQHLGVEVPQAKSIVGCDDIFGASLTTPSLTTVTSQAEQAGALATKALIARLGMTAASRSIADVVPARLTIRSSTGPAPQAR